ncbi:hypothetical protein [Nostoc sp. ChiQUE01b]|uniref:zinc ribbon domain-containing protein n=1 Tax=Nostoc sp. ChiQUE01b TaxID=3075376 RepID=UPI002AD21A7B|nr:hypothetical protein [Nostoc sp. ChiQUE01b]MDZ8259190.1 hypothetical protein [Nostoc sp. ChiQUE01b]
MSPIVDKLHKKTARFLVNNFDVILLPTFETSQMSLKAKRRIHSKSVRQMLTLSHYKVKQLLKHKAFENSKVVIDVNEAYTSKTISWTGEIVTNLGGAKVIKSKLTSTARRKSKVKSQKSKVLWNGLFRDFKWLLYLRRDVLGSQ